MVEDVRDQLDIKARYEFDNNKELCKELASLGVRTLNGTDLV